MATRRMKSRADISLQMERIRRLAYQRGIVKGNLTNDSREALNHLFRANDIEERYKKNIEKAQGKSFDGDSFESASEWAKAFTKKYSPKVYAQAAGGQG